eukprot:Skav222857  [mRNA]  locus=scaffold850:672545:673220:- [translate_table: standard]
MQPAYIRSNLQAVTLPRLPKGNPYMEAEAMTAMLSAAADTRSTAFRVTLALNLKGPGPRDGVRSGAACRCCGWWLGAAAPGAL